jgi:hypothetical protein
VEAQEQGVLVGLLLQEQKDKPLIT